MHDSVPTGDLTDLLGALPDCQTPLPTADDEVSLPQLSHDDQHVHHLIVVGGQECPGGSRWTDILDDYLVKGRTTPHVDPQTLATAHHRSQVVADLPAEGDGMTTPASLPLAPSLLGIVHSDSQPLPAKVDSDHTTPLSRHYSSQDKAKASRGPYVLVAKERLMGIYIACFALRTVEHLITGHDKATVTAGLLGGRVGNKGCAAISMRIIGVRMLFVSAHLAAHQGGQNLRKENVLKIRDELCIDDFTGRHKEHGGDPHSKRDITRDYDATFFFGDLNYRCDVSRLHADWLVRAQDWKNALEFDQLKLLLGKPGSCWEQWHEGEIVFAPTFKYDLLKLDRKHTLERKSSSRHLSLDRRKRRAETVSTPVGGLGLPAPVPTGAESDASRSPTISASSTRSSVSSLHELLLNGGLAALPKETAEELSLQVLTALRSPSSASLQVPSRTNSSVTDYDADEDATPIATRPSMHRSATIGSQSTQIADADAVYDTSKKQRVQSWCDRILWRTNMPVAAPPVDPSAPVPQVGNVTEGSVDLPRRFQEQRNVSDSTIRPVAGTSERRRRASMGFTNPFEQRNGHANGRPMTSPGLTEPAISEKDELPRRNRPRSRSEATTVSDEIRRKASNFLPGFSMDKTVSHDPQADRRTSVMSWRNWFGLAPTSAVAAAPEKPLPAAPQMIGPRRGEVEVLQYTSVDDLRTMEALSDHRPVKAVLLLGVGEE